MKKILLLTFYIFLLHIGEAQTKRNKVWVSATGGQKVIFDSVVYTSNTLYVPTYFTAGNSSICDTNGKLILSSDGYEVFDSLYNIIDGGDTLSPIDIYLFEDGWGGINQTSMFLPMDSGIYYFVKPTISDFQFNECMNNGGSCYLDLLQYNVIDMKANGGAGKVVQRMVPLLQNARLRKTQMIACRHGNGKDWWLLKQEGDSANVHMFLFKQDTVIDKGLQVFADLVWGSSDIRGQSAFNIDGSLYASNSHSHGTGKIFLADFDRCWGVLSNPRVLQMPTGSQHNPQDTTIIERLSVGLCFSPNNQFLYVVSMSNIYQYDLQDNSWFHVAGLDTTYAAFQDYENAYLGADNKIYIGNFAGLSKQMSRIDNPDVKGAGCNFCPRCLRFPDYGAGTPPCMPNYALGAKTCFPLDTPNMNLGSELEVFPNPAFSIMYIKNCRGKTKELYNSVGQVILSTTKDEINVSSLLNGIYYLICEGRSMKIIIK